MSYYLEINTGSFYHLAAETFREFNIEMSYQNKSKESARKRLWEIPYVREQVK